MSDGSPAADPFADEAVPARSESAAQPRTNESRTNESGSVVTDVLNVLASLKITVTLLALSLFLVLAGTLAQVNHDIWEVVHNYFRCWVAYIPLADLVPTSWFPPGTRFGNLANLPGGFIFPGGWTLGLALGINQLASMLTKFKVKARGTRLWIGLAVTAMGVAVTWAVVLSGMGGETGQGEPAVSYETLWRILQACVAVVSIGLSVWTLRVLTDPVKRKQPATVLIAGGAAIGLGLAVWSLFVGTVSDSSGRILWQLIKASFAAAVLLGGLLPIFGRQGGTFLLHCGLLLLLASEFHTGTFAREGVISLPEGEAKNYVSDTRSFEFALMVEGEDGVATHHVIDGEALAAAAENESVIDDPRLPVIVEPLKVYRNSDLRTAGGEGTEPNPDDVLPTGGRFGIIPMDTGTGVEAGAADFPAGLFRLRERGKGGKALGTVLGSALLTDDRAEEVDFDGGTLTAQLRFTREYLPFSVRLKDVRAEFYPGTTLPSHYSSDLRFEPMATPVAGEGDLAPPSGDEQGFNAFIWMNNPLRYAGRTFYQQGYDSGLDAKTGRQVRPENSVVQVVSNTGWMVPYVACMILAFGMLAQFGMSLVRFLARRGPVSVPSSDAPGSPSPLGGARRERGAPPSGDGAAPDPDDEPPLSRFAWLAPVAVVLVFGGYVASKWRSPEPYRVAGMTEGFDLAAFEKIPVLQGGRYKPLGTVARNAAKAMNGNRQEFLDAKGNRVPASLWLLDTMADSEAADAHRIFRITNPQVLETLGLKPRKGLTYARGEFAGELGSDDPEDVAKNERLAEARKRAKEASDKRGKKLPIDAAERAFLDFTGQLSVRDTLLASLNPEEFAPEIAGGLFPLPAYERVYQLMLEDGKAPLGVPRGDRWETPAHADMQEVVEELVYDRLGEIGQTPESFLRALNERSGGTPLFSAAEFDGEPDEVVEQWAALRTAWKEKQPGMFNLAVKRLTERLYEAEEERQLAAEAADEEDAAEALPGPGPREIETLSRTRVNLESWFNQAAPLYSCYLLYIAATLLTLVGWMLVPLGWGALPRSAAFWLLMFTFAIHTVALGMRIWISGRPPVTNLYSSAIFIGWAAVGLGLLAERLYGWGVGNGLACVAGVGTLLIAHSEPLSGQDTFEVLRAVLDTQFWLATHVVTITLGYAAVGAAGLLGWFYILGGLLTPALATVVGRPGSRSAGQDLGQALSKMIYGITCFAALLSLVGTILGGLWADDSWGRFWGWDPKENGAMLIVIWTALVLHARWGKLVGERGLAVLAVAGNIAVAWSWFGTNELGVGLHSYGFTEGVLFTLAVVAAMHLVVIAAGSLIPRSAWWSNRARADRAARIA
ncbi:cytochrome c biogenesis protein [Alienimonas chondri]|uniref:Cytochrome c biogenesis protein CcsA n=1 Tax=Alienimonas chondri TaxID=2681879 RepID=A0ABX1V7X5_9PLAN|nr:cytochrome c biogenesis protein CcsA [Alienimonas chondri]NNJ24210.1 Cytochrome c biogenesis protein CcsA [Alienimonas chondri]